MHPGWELVLCWHSKGTPLRILVKNIRLTFLKASTYVRELFAFTQTVLKWRQYLLWHHFSIVTDHYSLKEILTQVIHTPEQQKYVVKLLGYDFDISYQPGKSNIVADSLSRQFIPLISTSDSDGQFFSLSMATYQFLSQLRTEVVTDPYYQSLVSNPSLNRTFSFHLKDGLVYNHNQICIKSSSPIISQLLFEFHNKPLAGHGGVHKTLARIAPGFYWEKMKKDIQSYVAGCSVCQQTKYTTQKPSGMLQPLPVPNNVWEDISMDFITGLPSSFGFSVILVVVDRLSKYAHFGALKSGFTASAVASLFVDIVVKHHSFPKTIVSDRDPIFVSKFWGELFRHSGTSLSMSSAYHLQTDGQTEVRNRCLEQYLRAFVMQQPQNGLDISYGLNFVTTPLTILLSRCPLSKLCLVSCLQPFLLIFLGLALSKQQIFF